MKNLTIVFLIAFFIGGMLLFFTENGVTPTEAGAQTTMTPNKLMVVWTSGDRDVAIKMVFMYANAAKKNEWWEDVILVIWGPSSKLLSTDSELQKSIKTMQEAGVTIEACKACADMYDVSDDLAAMGVDVKYMGQPLTEALKSPEWEVVTF